MDIKKIAARIFAETDDAADFWGTESKPTAAERSAVGKALESCSSATKALVCVSLWLTKIGFDSGAADVMKFAEEFAGKESSES
jgi:hypothetical protein